MCIVSVKELESGKIIITHNRDEDVNREYSKEIVSREVHDQKIKSTQDLAGGGTWFYASQEYVVCVLNGGFQKHKRNPPYRKSRGKLILELLNYSSTQSFIDGVDLSNIEPFTMVILSRNNSKHFSLIWDGEIKHSLQVPDLKEYTLIRSSSTLYTDDQKQLFKNFLTPLPSDPDEIIQKHLQCRMPRNDTYPKVQTTSITQCIFDADSLDMKICPDINLKSDIMSLQNDFN